MAVTISEAIETIKLLLEIAEETSSSTMRWMAVTDHFQAIQELGKGSYGEVLLAKHRDSGQMVALKMQSKEKTDREHFVVEHSISLLLTSHLHIITTYRMAFETLTSYVSVQELAPAGTLRSIIKRKVLQMVSALEFMHRKSLVHRDIKADNILMDPECKCIKLADFGLTRIQGIYVPQMSWIIPYMAPELCALRHNEHLLLNPSLDVWALGILVYVMLTGQYPWNKALSSDWQYQDFICWHQGQVLTRAPSQWKRFTVEGSILFFQILAPNPTERCSVLDILHYINLPWTEEHLSEGLTRVTQGILTDQVQDVGAGATTSWTPCLLEHDLSISSWHHGNLWF
uniref:Protein kinase domain-containing protein n=1 Tax=Leptobrachium leishanense TaxID=445787 RepID=A0A8C5LLR5_9ANUR